MTAATEYVRDQLGVTDPTERKRITRTCELCGAEIEGWDRGSGHVAWKMGQHMRNKHKIAGKGRTGRPKKNAPTDEEYQAHPVTSTIRDVASAVGGTGKPNTDQLAAGLARGISISTFSAAAWLVESDPFIAADDKQKVIDHLTFPESDGRSLMRPVARMLEPTKLNAKYGRAVVDNVDVIGAVAAFAQFGYHWAEYLRMRRAAINETRRLEVQNRADGMGSAVAPPALSVVPPLPTNGVVPDGFVAGAEPLAMHPSGMMHTAPPVNGYVVSAEDVARLQRERANK